ncbi:MAG: PAS domain S-box protein [Asgard group archaeon]|nr:PAS domain S-box protein [Asgard group archaeon]
MTPKIKILHLEDNINDHELVKETLLLNDIDCEIVHADNKDDFIKFLEEITFDIILADFNLPSFDGFTALDYCKSVAKDTPFIFISGVLGEELAIETLKRGATDYVIKSRLERLVPAVTRALQEKEDKAQRILLERELVELEQVVNELKSTYDQLTRRVRGFLKIELPTLNYSIVDKFLEDLSGYNIKDWKEQPNFISTIIHPDYKEYYTENVDQLKDGFVPKMLEYKIVRKDMAERWWLQFNIGAFDVNGQLTSVSAVIVDNTVDKETQVKYQNLFENALTGMYRSDIDTGEIIEANERMAELLGCQSVEELKNYTANDFYVSSELRRNLVDQLYEQESYEENLMQLKKLDGTIIWVSESSRIYPDEGYIEGMLIDVTDRKKAEDALMRDRKIFQIIAESAVLSNTSEELCQKIIKDLIEILEFCCGSIRLLNDDNKLKPIAVVGKNLDLNNVPDIDLDDEKSMIANIARTKEEVFITDINKNNILSNLKIDLCSNYNAIISYPILSVDEVIGIIELYSPSIKENLSEDKPLFDAIADMLASAIIHRKAEEDLKDSEERFRAFAEQSLIGVALINKSGNFIFMNDEILRILEVSKYDIYNKSINEIQEGIMENLEVRNHIEYVIRKVIAEQITIIEEFRIISRSNKTKWLSTHFTPIRIKDDYAIAVIILEITDEKQAQMTVERERQAFHFLAEAIVNAKSIADLCQKIVMGICKTFNFDNGTFRIFNKEKETLEVIAAVLKDETKRQLIKTLDLQDTTYINTYVARTKDAVFAPDVSKHPIARQYDNRLQRFNAKANITYPILGSDKALLGTIQLVADEPKELPENDKFFFETIVRFFAAALEKMWTEEEQNRLTTIITHSDQVIISADANSNIIYANPATKNVFGYDPNEILGKPLSSLAPTWQQ